MGILSITVIDASLESPFATRMLYPSDKIILSDFPFDLVGINASLVAITNGTLPKEMARLSPGLFSSMIVVPVGTSSIETLALPLRVACQEVSCERLPRLVRRLAANKLSPGRFVRYAFQAAAW